MDRDVNYGVGNIDGVVKACLIMVGVLLALAALLIITFFLYRLLRVYALKNLEYRRYFTVEGAFENQEIEMVEELTNHSIIPMFRVDIETHITTKLYMPDVALGNEINQEFISRFFVMPFTRIRRHHKVIPGKRGFYKLESAKIYFMKIELYLNSEAELKVYPKELKMDAVSRLEQCMQINNMTLVPILRDPFSFAGIREYRTSDEVNNINHKATAKMGQLMVNEREFMMGRRIEVIFNFQAEDSGISSDDFEETLEQTMEFGAYLAGLALKNSWEIGLAANLRHVDGRKSVTIDIGTGYGKYMEILDTLAGARTAYGISIGRLLDRLLDQNMSYTEIYIFTAYVDESIERRLELFERQSNIVTIVDLKEVTTREEKD